MAKSLTKKQLEEMVQALTAKLAVQVQVPTITAAPEEKLVIWNKAVVSAVGSIVKDRKGLPQWVMSKTGFGELRATVIDLMQKKHQIVVSPDAAKLKKAVVCLVRSGRLVSNKKGQLLTKAQNVSKERKAKGFVIVDKNVVRYSQMFVQTHAKYAK